MNSSKKIIPCIILLMMSLNLCGFSTYIVSDTIRPQITGQAFDLIVQCGDDYSSELNEWYNINGGATASDNSGEVAIETTLELAVVQDSLSNSLGSFCNPENVFEVGFYAIDTCGNVSIDTSFARFQIIDNERPNLLTRASSVVLPCNEFAQDSLDNWVRNFGGASATDACSPTVEWFRIIWNDNKGNSSIGHPTDGPFIPIVRNTCDWEVTVSFFVRDECGNNQITTAGFSLTDTIAPQFVDPQLNVEVACNDILGGIEVSDNCNTNLVPTFEDLSSTQSTDSTSCEFFNYSLTRLWTVTDECGNSTSFEQMITVLDTVIPSFTVPADITIFCADDTQTSVTGFPTDIVDNCNPNPLVIFTDSGESAGCDFVISRFWQIADGCGSSNIVPQQITVVDTIRPQITVEASDLLLNCEAPDSLNIKFDTWLGNIGGASAQDECASVEWFAAVPGSYDVNDSSTFPGDLINSVDDVDCGSGEVMVDFVFVDDCSNAVVTSAIFTLVDTIAPTFREPFEDLILEADSSCMASMIMLFPQVSDNCLQDSQVVKKIRFENTFIETPSGRFDTILQSGVYDFAYIIEDCSGNTDSIVSSITIRDTLAPSLICPVDTESAVDLSTCISEVILSTDFVLEENCGIESLSYRVSGVTLIDLDSIGIDADSIVVSLNAGSNLVEYVARDESGNESSCTFTVEVSDIEAQDIECKSETIYLSISDPNPFVLTDSVFVENLVDNCFIDSIFIPIMNVTCDQIGETIGVQLTIFDKTGSSQNCTSILMVEVEDINPSYENKFCASDTLKLFSNIPSNGDIDQNVYSWIGPNNFVASTSDPVLVDVDTTFSGMYFLTVTGEAGCSQTDSIMVDVESFETPILSSSQDGGCVGDSIFLEATAYDLTVLYSWYQGVFPDGDLIDTSSFNQLNFNPTQGANDYYVIVSKDDCTSAPSNIVNLSLGDVVPPLITCPNDTVLNLGLSACVIDFALPTNFSATDDCGLADTLVVNYVVDGEGMTITDSLVQTNTSQIDSLGIGNYTAIYAITDLASNSDSCSFLISVMDTIAPALTCKNDTVQLSIAQLNNFSVNFFDVVSEASDNCQLDTVLYEPNNIDCVFIGEQVMISVKAIDMSGNTAECNPIVNVSLDTLVINYTSGLCPGDTLKLNSNIADTTGLNFEWNGPSGFVSTEPSPIVVNPSMLNSGLYKLIVGSDGACSVNAELNIELLDFATPFVTSNASLVCEGESLELRTQNYGANIIYSWYEGNSPNGTLIEETNEPSLILTSGIGTTNYYVIVSNEDCSSLPSEAFSIETVGQPSVVLTMDNLSVCSGDAFTLSIDNLDASLDYEWSGPNGFSSEDGNPNIELIAGTSTAGIYKVVSKIGECISDTASVEVILNDGVASVPIIEGETAYCEGSAIDLSVRNITDADNYTWLQNGEVYSITDENVLLISDAGQQFSGDWQVYIAGACNNDTSNILQINISADLTIVASSNSPVCGSARLQLEVEEITDATYSWEGPDGFTSNERNPIIDPVAGEYTVTVIASETCESTSSTIVEIKGRPAVQEIESNIKPCGSTETELRLTPITSENETYTYEWTGPDGFTSTDEIAVVENFNVSNEGVYSLIISNGECESLPSNIVVSTGDGIETPVIFGSREICLGQSILLEVEDVMVEVDEFIWSTPQGEVKTEDPSLTIISADDNDAGGYSLAIASGNCISDISNVISISVGNGLATPIIISEGPFCNGETIQLQVENGDGEYEWRGPNDFQAFDPNPVIFNISNVFSGEYEVRAVGADCTSSWSQPFDLQLVDVPVTPMPTITADVLCINDVTTYDLCIEEGSLVADAAYIWLHESTGDTIGSTVDLCLTISANEKFSLGQNNVNVTTSLGSCVSDLSRTVVITMTDGEGGELTANAGEDVSICEDLASFDGQLADGQTGSWSSPNTDIDFTDSSSPSSGASGFVTGENIVVWTVQGESCSGKGTDTLSVFYAFEPVLQDDEYDFVAGQQVVFDPLANDDVSSDFTFEILSLSGGEQLDASDPRAIGLEVEDGFGGVIEVMYEVCDGACPELCNQAIAFINIEGQKDCIATSLITPNGDGINDNFEIPCLDGSGFPDNKLTIFNQWGDEVYAAQPYQNNWQGTFNDQDLPVGTYFFILNLGDGLRLQNGFIQLER